MAIIFLLTSWGAYPFQCGCKLHKSFVKTDKLEYFNPNEEGQNGHHVNVDDVPKTENIQALIGQLSRGLVGYRLDLKGMPYVID